MGYCAISIERDVRTRLRLLSAAGDAGVTFGSAGTGLGMQG
jgi:hypothetical protein